MFAAQYRPGFISSGEPLAVDVPVAGFGEMAKLSWMRRWETAINFVRWEESTNSAVGGSQFFIISAVQSDDHSYVVGYLSELPLFCVVCSHWRTHCRAQCLCTRTEVTND